MICPKNILLIFVLPLLVEAHGNNDLEPPRATTKNGKIEGTWKISTDGRQYAAFEGIPFAKPPIGNLRFKEPQPAESWAGIWKADKIYDCPQASSKVTTGVAGDEDCLYLNVFVPKIEKTDDLDVLVHIHGGGFFTGNSIAYIDPKYAMDRDWIFVTMNYRLGALGFLSTEDDIVPGNNGLKDQVLALKWVKDNIANFGGNSSSVTLSGFSAGGASVHFHYFSSLSKGLFNRGISNSGTALNPWTLVENPLQKARALSKALGCDCTNNQEMVNCLRQRPASLIIKKTVEHMHPFARTPFCPFAPVIENGSINMVLTEHPHKLLKEGKVLDVPWIASITTEEGLDWSFALADKFEEIEKNWSKVAKYILDYDAAIPPGRENEIAFKIKEFYLPKDSNFHWSVKSEAVTKMFTDRGMAVDAENAAELQSKVVNSPIYFSKFQYEGANSWKLTFTDEYIKGASHGDDMIYYLGGQVSKPLTEKDSLLRNILMDVLYSYVHSGSPVTEKVKWNPIKDTFTYLNITDPDLIKMDVKNDYSANHFWKDLGLLENGNLISVKNEL